MRNILKWYHEIIAISVTLSTWAGGTASFVPATWTSYTLSSLPIWTQIALTQIQWVDTYVFLHNNNEIWILTTTPGSWYKLDWVNVNSTPVSSTAITLSDGDTINVAFCLPDYLWFTANTAWSTIKLAKNGSPTEVTLETSTDWNTWSTYTFWDTITLANIWDKVYWRNTSETDTGFSTSTSNYYKFEMTGSIAWSGDINFLLNKNSATALSRYCYISMFQWCTWLTSAPALPATTLADRCYSNMFKWCTWLTTAPALPATTLFDYCYAYMFQWCTWLTSAPALPATTLDDYCYAYMFQWCTWLTSAPALPATTSTSRCYYYMFYRCTWLTSIPALPSTALPTSCYAYMFNWCSNIKLSTEQTWEYQTAYRIPSSWDGQYNPDASTSMFWSTGWTFKGTPAINTTYYTSNTVVS